MKGCWYCRLANYHPRCDNPGCNNQKHGHGDDGKTVFAYCELCRGTSA